MNIKRNKILLPLLAVIFQIIFSTLTVSAQESKGREAQKVFFRFEEGLNSSAVDKFSSYFGDKNYLSLANGTAGYYSANQSYYVMKDFLSVYQSSSFKLSNIVTETSTPFASGILKYNNKGIRGTATVFISLQLVDNQWRISQITIN
ncbi:MAG: hypothetical protein CVV24_01610 [Ignavibacteriae bacterium HGW-Ignavibacteriae-3]|nr:MAG: hypothetical protein CVV24_01610 [Ignavibacteriae bacterium HGW-Ignavibacteriae-3]